MLPRPSHVQSFFVNLQFDVVQFSSLRKENSLNASNIIAWIISYLAAHTLIFICNSTKNVLSELGLGSIMRYEFQ